MSKKNCVFRHFDEWSKEIKRLGDGISVTGVYFKHGQPLHVQRMIGHVVMDFSSITPDGETFTSRMSQAASWNAECHCSIKGKRCKAYDLFRA